MDSGVIGATHPILVLVALGHDTYMCMHVYIADLAVCGCNFTKRGCPCSFCVRDRLISGILVDRITMEMDPYFFLL